MLDALWRAAGSIARVRRMYNDWIKSRNFDKDYKTYKFGIPRRLTKKELIKLREVSGRHRGLMRQQGGSGSGLSLG